MILPHLVIEDDILPALVAYCREKHHTLFMLVCDNNTYRALGRRVEQGLRAQGWDVLTAKLEGAEVIADEDHIIQVLLHHDGLPRTYLAVGSGTITDIARFASHRSGRPFLSLPTAASVDGFTSIGAPLVVRGLKVTITCQGPEALFAELPVLVKAPHRLTASGFGDLLGKYTALADWSLGRLLWDERYDAAIANCCFRSLEKVAGKAAEIGAGEPQAVQLLMEGLVNSGLCMLEFGDSHPASGTEHHISHLWELILLRRGRPAVFHGLKVGVGTVIAASHYERLREISRTRLEQLLPGLGPARMQVHIDTLRALLGPAADRLISDMQPFLEMTPSALAQLKNRLVDNWDEVQEIAATVPPAEELAARLHQAGAAVTPAELGFSDEEAALGINLGHFLRARFTVNKLRLLLGF